jgi:hypothetical protein
VNANAAINRQRRGGKGAKQGQGHEQEDTLENYLNPGIQMP